MTAKLYISGTEDLDKRLAALERVSRMPVLKRGLRAAGEAPKRRLRQILPKPGYPGDKPELKPLRDAIGNKTVEYQNWAVLVQIVGYEWGTGSHGHMVEEGHEMVTGGTSPKPGKGRKTARKSKRPGQRGDGRVVGFVAGKHYLQQAFDSTKAEQSEAIQDAINTAIAAAGG